MDIPSDDDVLMGSGNIEGANAQKRVQHLIDIEGDNDLNEHFNDAAADEIPNNVHNLGSHQGGNVEEDIENSDPLDPYKG